MGGKVSHGVQSWAVTKNLAPPTPAPASPQSRWGESLVRSASPYALMAAVFGAGILRRRHPRSRRVSVTLGPRHLQTAGARALCVQHRLMRSWQQSSAPASFGAGILAVVVQRGMREP